MRNSSTEAIPSLPQTPALRLGQAFFGLATMASGLQQLVTGGFVRLVPKLPAWIPVPSVWARLVGVVLVAAGLAILSRRRTWQAAGLVAAMLVLLFLLLQVPRVVSNPWVGFMWTNPLKTLALAGGAGILAEAWSGRGAGLRSLGALFLATFLVVGGVQHFVYSEFVATLVPSWIPAHAFWTPFTGLALIAGGAGILVRPTARLAATMSGVMIFLWVLLLHIPRALAEPGNAGETSGIFEALALSGVALLVAATVSPGPVGGRDTTAVAEP